MVETVFDLVNSLGGNGIWFWYFFFIILIGVWANSKNRNAWAWMAAALFFSPLLTGLVLLFSGKIEKKEEIKEKPEVKKEEKKEIKKEIEQEYYCEYCDKKFKSEDALNKHYDSCEAKKIKSEKDTKTTIWVVSIIVFIGLGIYFLINNKINLIPLFLIGLIAIPFFDKLFNRYKKKSNRLKHFEFNWWKKGIAILAIILLFVLINWLIPECPKSCNDNNSCTNDFCRAETGYKCMSTLKLHCKGNGICESGEYGTSDCPDCNDGNKCTADSYDIGSKQCIHAEMNGSVR